jgi:hypothetical protein
LHRVNESTPTVWELLLIVFVAPNSHSVRSRLTSEVDSNAKEYGIAIWDNPRLLGESTKRWKIDNGEDHSSKLCMILGAQKFLPVTLTVIKHQRME